MRYNVFIKRDWFNNWLWLRFGRKWFFEGKVVKSQETRLPQLLKDIGFFKSTSEARRAGYDGEVPKGWNEIQTNSGKYLSLFNPTKSYFK